MLESWLTSRPVAHRGLYDLAAGRPENSLAAFAAAAAAGYPCELDVHLTDSGDLVVLHDFDLGRATGVARPVATLTAADLPGIRLFGSDQRLPALAQVTECVAGRVPLLLELKRRGSADPRALVNSVLRHLETSDGEYALSSFDPVLVYFLRRAKAGYPLGQISGLLRTAGPVKRLIGRSLIGNVLTRPDFMSYELAGLPSLIVSAWRRRGVPVLAWPVRSAADELQARKYADNIIFSDFRPEKLMRRKCPVLLALCHSPIPAPGPRPASWRSITSAGGSGYPRMRRTPWPGRSTWAGSPATSRPRPACCPG